jgi:digeranylgeranylglycerophospholipid reductase
MHAERAERVDVLVVGGGPAGLVAARVAAERGCQVLLVERDPAIGLPVRCGEGVGSRGIEEFLDPEDGRAPWISRRITRVEFRSPNGSVVRVGQGDIGYVLDRSRFEPVLAAQAVAAGAVVRTGAEVSGLARDGAWWDVRIVGADSAIDSVRARIVIAADGVESMVGRWAGIDTRVRAKDMESCAQFVVDDVDIDPSAIVLHFGQDVAPGGYAWIFPKSERSANVGLGVVALRANRSALGYLDDYVRTTFPDGTKRGRTVGGVVVQTTVRNTVGDGIILCGDAAHMINPLSGAGIVNAMKAGRLAGETVADTIVSAKPLSTYHERWMHMLGRDHERFYRVKEQLGRFDDAFYDRLACSVNSIPEQKRTLRRIFCAALVEQPALLPVILRYFA